MHELERLQPRRRGEDVRAPLNVRSRTRFRTKRGQVIRCDYQMNPEVLRFQRLLSVYRNSALHPGAVSGKNRQRIYG